MQQVCSNQWFLPKNKKFEKLEENALKYVLPFVCLLASLEIGLAYFGKKIEEKITKIVYGLFTFYGLFDSRSF